MKAGLIEKIAAIGLVCLVSLVTASAAGRYLFNWPIPDTLDFSRIFLGITVLWGIALSVAKGDQIQVDLLWEHLGSQQRKLLVWLNRIVMLVFMGLFSWLVLEHIWHLYGTGKQTVDFRLQLWWFYLLLVPTGIIPIYITVCRLFEKVEDAEEQG